MEYKVYGEKSVAYKRIMKVVRCNSEAIGAYFRPIADKKVYDADTHRMAYNVGQQELARTILNMMKEELANDG